MSEQFGDLLEPMHRPFVAVLSCPKQREKGTSNFGVTHAHGPFARHIGNFRGLLSIQKSPGHPIGSGPTDQQ